MKNTTLALLLVCGLNATAAQANSLALGVHAPVTVIETRAQSILAEEHKLKARETKHQYANQQDGVSKLFKQLKAFMAKAISE